MNKNKIAKTPKKDFFWGAITGHALSLRAGRLNYMKDCIDKDGDFLEMFLGKRRTLLVNDPEGIKYVLLDNAKNYPKNTPGYQRVAEVLGQGVFTDVGEEWREGRAAIRPTFNPSKFDHYFKIVDEEKNKTLKKMNDLLKSGEEINMSSVSTAYALHVIGRSLFNDDLEESFNVISKNLSHLIDLTEKKMTWITPFMTPTKKKITADFNETLARLDNEALKIINNERKKEKNVKENMIHALFESPKNFSDTKILSQVKTMIFAGHETTATVIAWCFFYLSENPEWQEKIYEEFKAKNFDVQSEEELDSFESLNLFLKEVMRMRPPAWSFGRIALADDQIHGTRVRKGDLISLSPYFIQHHKDYWNDPYTFRPERFKSAPVPYTYIPFGLGPRICMGEKLANLEMRILLLNMMKNFVFEKTERSSTTKINAQVSLRPDKDIYLKVTARKV